MRLGTIVEFLGDAGEHNNDVGQDCPGRSFRPKVAGVGGAYISKVECTTCHIQLDALENGLLPFVKREIREAT
jgi:hypothetical protein